MRVQTNKWSKTAVAEEKLDKVEAKPNVSEEKYTFKPDDKKSTKGIEVILNYDITQKEKARGRRL